ncbi:MAG TPA: hypothetical protein PK605_11750 [Ignavibacteria bacterium]|nr:hypothetical protein [Ignavibacteria bacterium]HRF66266.1 hypothetical protein [Ignavibacteria bacterium]HRJ05067.1 hypothetical protein [Ignavibacteria bacterium]
MEKYIFCYLDILGYKSIVAEHCNNEELIGIFRDIVKDTVIGLPEGFMKPLDNSETSKFVEGVYGDIKTTLISDTILIRMPIVDIKENNEQKAIDRIGIFLHYVSFLVLTFVRRTGYFLRGGIAIEQHFEDNEKGNLFIFSKALIKSYELEQKAKSIRILVTPDIVDYLCNNDENRREEVLNLFYKDSDDLLCLDYYQPLTALMHEDFFSVLMGNVRGQIWHNRKDQNILYKYLGFIKYHNTYIESREELNKFKIDLNIVLNENR